jgi:hypothetical protein
MGDIENMVGTLITSSKASNLKTFTFGAMTFTSGLFKNVKNLIDAGFVKIVYEEKRPAGSAEYDTGTNTLYISFPKCFDLPQEALVIHEMCHAAYDLAKVRLTVADSESIAYIVQCMYARMQSTDPSVRLQNNRSKARDKVFETGWELAGKIMSGQSLSFDDYNAMRDAVSKHPFYSANFSHDAKMNG